MTPPLSNTPSRFKKMAGFAYFQTARSHASTTKELINQYKVIHRILSLKGFNPKLRSRIQNYRPRPANTKKRFLSKSSFNGVTSSHSHVRRLALDNKINLEKYYLPTELPGKKLEQSIFTIRKMRAKLNF